MRKNIALKSLLVLMLGFSFCQQAPQTTFVWQNSELTSVTQPLLGPDPTKLLTKSSLGKSVLVWQVGQDKPILSFDHGDLVSAFRWSPDGKSVLTCTERSCFLWTIQPIVTAATTTWTEQISWVLDIPTIQPDPIVAIGFVPRRTWVWVLRTNTVSFVNWQSNKIEKSYSRDIDEAGQPPFFDVSSAGDRFLFKTGGQLTEYLLDDSSFDWAHPAPGWKWALFSQDHTKIVTLVPGSTSSKTTWQLLTIDVNTHQQNSIGNPLESSDPQTFITDKNQHVVITGSSLGIVDLDLNSMILTNQPHLPISQVLCVSAQAQFLVYPDGSSAVKVWSQLNRDKELPHAMVGPCTFSPDEHLLATSVSGKVTLWDTSTF